MKPLADENFPARVITALKDAGHDVCWVRTEMPEAWDEAVLRRAQDDGRLLVTFDKDFGELAVRAGASATHGVVLFRLRQHAPDLIVTRVVEALSASEGWSNSFVVVEDSRIRIRPIP